MNPRWLGGHFLIAGRSLLDPNFFRSVVLILEHNEQGALGLIVNRPTRLRLKSLFQQLDQLPEVDGEVYIGGPVQPGAVFLLHNVSGLENPGEEVCPGVFAASNVGVFRQVFQAVASGYENVRFRVCGGYAGWGAQQLESELARADWLVLPASAEWVCDQDPYELWERLYQKALERNRLLPHLKGNPEWN